MVLGQHEEGTTEARRSRRTCQISLFVRRPEHRRVFENETRMVGRARGRGERDAYQAAGATADDDEIVIVAVVAHGLGHRDRGF
jgi:hypothetical protein